MEDDSQATQQATQNATDPRRYGKQNSGFSDEDISDIVCLLHPITSNASDEIQRLADSPEYSHFTVGRYTADSVNSDLYLEDDARNFGRNRTLGQHAIVLRMSTAVKDRAMGFTFGRNSMRCDICFEDPGRRLSNIHFRIYINEFGSILLEDQSTNGTIVDNMLLRKSEARGRSKPDVKRTLESGSTIKVIMMHNSEDLIFLVRIPRRDGETENAYLQNLAAYLRKANEPVDLDRTIGPGPSGHVNLFPAPVTKGKPLEPSPNHTPQGILEKTPREWRGGDKYARQCVIGKGAFATVYKVTSRYDGTPYAAKELDKRKFVKDGVMDQKVENEMRIMQKIQHANIVQYIEHFDWDVHQFIIIMEYVPGGDLGKLVLEHGSIREPHVKPIATQLIDALGYLHDNKITHRDVKPDNILIQSLDPFVVKLTDFGLSKMIETEQTFLKTFCGTLLYCAPEVYLEYASYDDNGRRTQRKSRRVADRERYDHAVDIWSLGGVLFYALTGRPPFPAKNGVSYTELLDHIIKTPVNTAPLARYGVSNDCVEFLKRMIHVRPETRATITELQAHPWLNDHPDSFEEIPDKDLDFGASQLSLDDRLQDERGDGGAYSQIEPGLDFFSMEYESEKENNGPVQLPTQNKLFGEVNNSALGSSGTMTETRLNLPVSNVGFGETDILDPVIQDSFEDSENLSTPRQRRRSIVDTDMPETERAESELPDASNTGSVVLGIGSQSLGGTSSIFGHLNMSSRHNGNLNTRSLSSELNTSKRKTGSSDEYESSGATAKPMMKRLKSIGDARFARDLDAEDEYTLFASIPPLAKNESGRQIDNPLSKTTFWDSSDKKSWHLEYPEMTLLQYNAFERAAEKRREEFGPGRTPLWDLAMRYFPPTHEDRPGKDHRALELRPALLKRNSRNLGPASDCDWGMSPTDPFLTPYDDDGESIPDTLPPPETQPPPISHNPRAPKRVVARFDSPPDSLLPGISFTLADPILSWGRERHNTVTYYPVTEAKVPKNAFRVLLWREGYSASGREYRPWDATQAMLTRTMRTSPDPDTFAFYISTKATNGVRINNIPLRSNLPKGSSMPCKYWMKLYHGDTIAFWGTEDVDNQAKLTFECYWGSSSVPRPSNEPPTCVPETVARKLDRLWPKAVDNLSYDRIKTEANIDHDFRMRHASREQARSRAFEQKRAEAVRILSLRATRGPSPASAPPGSMAAMRFGMTVAPATQY